MTTEPESIVDALTDSITLRILRGELAPGARLPSVRTLAATHRVNVSTVQRVLAKLEEQGLVSARPRSGVTVLDPVRHGGTSLLPVVLRHARTDVPRAVSLLRDALATRRVLALHVARTLAVVPFERYGAQLRAATDRFAEIASARRPSLAALSEAENEILRTALVAAEMPIVLAVVNDITAMLHDDPSVLASFYADPGPLVAGWRAFVEMLALGGPLDRFAFVEPFLAAMDARVVADFEKGLRAKSEKKREKKR